MTGFRSTAAGWWGLEEREGTPYDADLTTFGKIIGGGLPLAGLGGRAEILDLLAPLGPVYQAGTLSGNPVAVATGAAMLRGAGPEVYEHLPRVARTIGDGLSDALTAEGVAHTVAWAGSQFSIFFRETAPQNYAEAQDQDTWRFGPFFHAMLEHGVSLPPSVYEAWFVSAAHDDRGRARAAAAPRPRGRGRDARAVAQPPGRPAVPPARSSRRRTKCSRRRRVHPFEAESRRPLWETAFALPSARDPSREPRPRRRAARRPRRGPTAATARWAARPRR